MDPLPLALLAFEPGDPSTTARAILSHSLWRVGGTDSAGTIDQAAVIGYGEKEKWKFDPKDQEHLRILRGAKVLGVAGSDCAFDIRLAEKAEAFLSTAGRAAKIGVNCDMNNFWRVLHTARQHPDKAAAAGGKISWREFRFLCAILSKVGAHKFDKVGWQEIQARAAGFAGKLDLQRAGDAERDRRRELILTQDQIRTTREAMERGNWFVRVKWSTSTAGGNGGESWYSFSTGEKGLQGRARLAQWIAERKAVWREAREDNRANDLDLVAAAIAQRQAARPERRPKSPNTNSATGSHGSPNMNSQAKGKAHRSPIDVPPIGYNHGSPSQPLETAPQALVSKAMPEPCPMGAPNSPPNPSPNSCPNPCPNINDRRGVTIEGSLIEEGVQTREAPLTKEVSLPNEAVTAGAVGGVVAEKGEQKKALLQPDTNEEWETFLHDRYAEIAAAWGNVHPRYAMCRSLHGEFDGWKREQPASERMKDEK